VRAVNQWLHALWILNAGDLSDRSGPKVYIDQTIDKPGFAASAQRPPPATQLSSECAACPSRGEERYLVVPQREIVVGEPLREEEGGCPMTVRSETRLQGGTVLELENIGMRYGNIHALRGVNITVRQDEVTCVPSDNGAGKSTPPSSISPCGSRPKPSSTHAARP
jgi:ABC-type multidrug transport system fused ATPase/permease subunit